MKIIPNCKQYTTIGKLYECKKKYIDIFIQKSFFYEASLEQLAKHFLNDFLDINVWQNNFKDILVSYRIIFEDTNCPEDSKSFYEYVANEYLDLVSAPKSKLFKMYQQVSNDLQEITNTIEKLTKMIFMIDEQKNDKGYLEVEDRYKKLHIEFYIEKNKKAKEEIIDFFINDIHRVAYQECKKELFPNFLGAGLLKLFGSNMYPYYNHKKTIFAFLHVYDMDDFSELNNKMMDLPVSTHRKINQLHKDGKTEEFFDCIKEYIQDRELVNKFSNLIEINHIMNERKEILKTIFRHFENNDFISVNHMLPLQIEGLFHDYCILVGLNEKELNIASLNDKLKKLRDKDDERLAYSYEYFAFRFPIIRNKVAHGRYFGVNDELQALLLLLDLETLCDMITNEKIPLNEYIHLIKSEANFETLLNLSNYHAIKIPDFYKDLEKKLNQIKPFYSDDKFINFLNEKIVNSDAKNKKELTKKIGYIKKSFLGKSDKIKYDDLFCLLKSKT